MRRLGAIRPRPIYLLLIAHLALVLYSARVSSPCVDESGHLAAGLHHWQTGTFDLYRVNPPLVRLFAVFPMHVLGVELPPVPVDTRPPERSEFVLGWHLSQLHGPAFFDYLFAARAVAAVFAAVGTWVIYRWSKDLYGEPAGLMAAFVWAVNPNVLAYSQLLVPDAVATALGAAACYAFWRWLRQPSWNGAAVSGFLLGLAELGKTTFLPLFALFPALWVALRLRPPADTPSLTRGGAAQLLAQLVLAVAVINVGYGFEGTGRALGAFRFVSEPLTGLPGGAVGNRFRHTPLGDCPVPVPANYVSGIDVQKRDFERGVSSYRGGVWRNEGWWDYYLYALGLKTPPGTLALFALAGASYLVFRAGPSRRADELILLAPGLLLFTFVSSQTGFSHHLRYALPALPFLHVWLGRAWRWWDAAAYRPLGRGLLIACLVSTCVSTAAVYPHTLAYFNTFAGGPRNGSAYLIDSNLDWGQSLFHFKRWCDRHPDARPLYVAYYGGVDPQLVGIAYQFPPPLRPREADGTAPRFRPGWYAVSVNLLRGMRFPISDGAGGTAIVDGAACAPLLTVEPVARVGYSIYVYHLDESTCEQFRRASAALDAPADHP